MDVTCQSCRATYKVDDAKIPAQGIKAKCPKCGHSFLLKKPEDDDVIAVGGDTSPPPAAPSDPFAGFGAAPVPDMGSSPAPVDPFGSGGADPFSGGFGGSAPSADPFAGGFGGGGFGSGGFDSSASAPDTSGDIGGLFQAKTAFEVKRTNGEKLGPFDLFTIKQMIYEGQLNGSESLMDASSNWVPITTVEDLGEIFRLTGTQPAGDTGSSQWGGQPEPAPKGGWVKHESAAPQAAAPATPMSAKGSRPVPPPAAPAAPVALDMGRKPGIGERVIIIIESLWALARTRGARIAAGVLAGLVVLALLGYQFRWQIAHLIGLAGPIEATRLVVEGDRTLASGERGPMFTALARYDEALKKYPKSVDAQARSAELAGMIWYRDPPRLDMKAVAEANLEKALARGESYAVVRAQARVALARRDLPAAEAALTKAAAMPEAATDPLLSAIRGDVFFEKGDMAAAEAAYVQAKAAPATAAHGGFGIARIKLRANQFDAAKAPLGEALALEPDNGAGRAMSAYLSSKTGGDLAAARKTLRELAAAPNRFGSERSRASYYLGVLSEEAGFPSPALHHMRDAARHYPSDAEVAIAAKRLFKGRFSTSNVDAWFTGISRIRGSTAMDRVQTAEIEFQRRAWQAALSPLISATQADTVNAAPQYALGLLLVEVSEAEKAKAKANFQRAMDIDPEWAEPVIALSRWQLDAKAIPDARALATKAVKLDPTLPDAYRVVAAGAMAAKDYVAAQEALQVAVEFDPEDYISWLDLGEARRLGGQAEEAIPAVEKAAALRPELSEPRIRLGAVYEALGDLAKANEFYVEAAKIDPANLTIATRAGVIDARQANYIEARKRLEAVVKAQSGNGEAQDWLGIAHHQTGEPEKALEAYKAAIKADYFDKYLAHWHMGELLGSAGANREVEAARDQLNKCLALKPEHFQCLEEQARIAISENQYDDAVKLLRAVETSIAKLPGSQKDPVIVRVQLQQGKIFRQQGKLKEAEALFRKILKHEKNAEVMWNLGELAKENEPRVAKDWYQKAIKANEAYGPPYRDLGYILKEEGNDCAAKRNLQLFLAKTPNEKERKPVEEDLQNLDCGK